MRRLVLVVVVVGACRGKADDVPCPSVASRFFMIARDDLAKATVDPTTRRMVSDQLPAMRDALAEICSDGGWSLDVRRCLANAADHVAFEACEQQLTDAQRHKLDKATRGDTE
jgi:hypothetical protein